MKRKVLIVQLVLLALFQPLADTSARAQEPGLVVTIDGSKEPEKVPEWILWREMFMVAGMLSEKSANHGDDVWVGRVGLTNVQMNALIARAAAFRAEEAGQDLQVQALRADSSLTADALKTRLAQMTVQKRQGVLDHRDGLRGEIGADAVARMLEFARKNIAPTVKFGEVDTPGSGATSRRPQAR
jgi:hypothetical protein